MSEHEIKRRPFSFLATIPDAEVLVYLSKALSKFILTDSRGGHLQECTAEEATLARVKHSKYLDKPLFKALLTENSPEASPPHTRKSSCGVFAKGIRKILAESSAGKVQSDYIFGGRIQFVHNRSRKLRLFICALKLSGL
ncbi:hypothetical protein EPI10_016959 [Gossypium australe]|uniref:Uncharacterized protein n=1 Tax=Gossypium australe TaxID=47621 RepID=A0A5B6VQR8_9ROSI|nr:hypothetical protein EPI10_016959 [Gossypium australe]